MDYPTYLIHYGTLGQKWGIRKYQNEDGTWTEEGLRRRRKENFKELIKDAQSLTDNCDSKLTIKESSTLDTLGAYSGPIRYAFVDKCCELAKKNTLSDAKQSRIKSLLASGKSQAEVAKILGVSTSTVNKYK